MKIKTSEKWIDKNAVTQEKTHMPTPTWEQLEVMRRHLDDASTRWPLVNDEAMKIWLAVNSYDALLEVKQRAEDLAYVVRNGGNYRKAVEWFDEGLKEYQAIVQADTKGAIEQHGKGK